MRKKSASIKSVRFTESQLAYIGGLEGRNFTEKLSALVDDAMHGDKRRREELAYYESLLERRRKELQSYNSLLSVLSGVRRDALRLEVLMHDVVGRMKEASAIQPEAGQERPP